MLVSIIVPFRGIHPSRLENLEFLKTYLNKNLDFNHEIILSDDPDPHTFNRGRAANVGVAKSQGEILIIQDTDFIIDPEVYNLGVDLTYNTNLSYLVPFTDIYFLTESASSHFKQYKELPTSNYLETHYTNRPVGGINIVTRHNFDLINGFDNRFKAWGCEDIAWDLTMSQILYPPVFIQNTAYHLWHPRPDKPSKGRQDSIQLYNRYLKADKQEIQKLIQEAKEFDSGMCK